MSLGKCNEILENSYFDKLLTECVVCSFFELHLFKGTVIEQNHKYECNKIAWDIAY